MNIEKYEEQITNYDMSYAVRSAAKAVRILYHYQSQIEKFNEKFPDRKLSINADSIQLSCPSRETGELGWFLQCFGGKWEKEPNGESVDFVQKVPNPFGDKGYNNKPKIFLFLASQAPLPPSCTIEEVEELVPAVAEHTRRVKRVVCEKGKENEPEPLPPVEQQPMVEQPKNEEVAF